MSCTALTTSGLIGDFMTSAKGRELVATGPSVAISVSRLWTETRGRAVAPTIFDGCGNGEGEGEGEGELGFLVTVGDQEVGFVISNI